MRSISWRVVVSVLGLVTAFALGVSAQVYRYYTPGSVWTVTTIRVKPGMDQAYLAYLAGDWKRTENALVKAGYEKSYKVLRTMDDDAGSYNFILLREYADLASMEANREKADAVSSQVVGDDTKQMRGYDERAKVRELVATRYAREIVLK